MEKQKVIIIDDHRLFAEGLQRILDEMDLDVLGICSNGKELFCMLNNIRPDLLLMDIQMAGQNGLDLCQKIKREYSGIKVILISMFETNTILHEAKVADADGFIPKTTDAALVKTTILEILEGKQVFLKPQIMESLEDSLPNMQLISKREKDIIAFTKEGLTAKTIAKKLNLSKYTVETHRRNILKKLNLKSVKDLIAFAYKYNF